MKEVFTILPIDSDLVIKTKREANFKLASLNRKSKEFAYNYNLFSKLIGIFDFIEQDSKETIRDIIKSVKSIYDTGILFPLTLEDNEFKPLNDKEVFENIRYPYIYKTLDNKYVNTNAFNVYVKESYSDTIKIQNKVKPFYRYGCTRLYIAERGVVTGNYIEKCYIRDNVVKRHKYTIQSIINISVCDILDYDISIMVVDKFEPNFNILREFYDVPIEFDENIANRNYNINNYQKL